MEPQIYPKQSTPLILDAGSKDSKPFQCPKRGEWYIRLGVSIPNLLGNPPSDGEVPLASLKTGDGPLCQVSTSETNVVSDETGQVAQVTRATFGASIFSFKLNVTRVVEKWQLHIENTGSSKRMFTWVVADNEPDSKQPWIDVIDSDVDFGQVTDEKLDKPELFRVGNRGTGKLRVDGIRDLPSVFTVVTTLPINIDPGRSATIEIKPTSKPSVAIESTCTVQSNDSTTGHKNQITLKASPPPAPRLPTIESFNPTSLRQGDTKPDFVVNGSNLNEMELLRFHREGKSDWIETKQASNDGFTFIASVTVKADAPTDKPYTLELLRGDGDPDPTKCATCATPFLVTPAQPKDLTMTPNHGCLGTRLTNYKLGGKNLGNVKQVSFEPTGNIEITNFTPGQTEIGLELDIKEDAQIGDYDLILAPSEVKIVKAFCVKSAATIDAIQPNSGIQGTTLPAFILGGELSKVEGQIRFRQVGKTEDAPSIEASIAHFGDETPPIPFNTEVMKLAFSDEGRHLLVLLADVNGAGPAVRRYEFPQYKLLNQVRLDKEELQGCILSPTESHFVTVRAGSPPLVILWDATNGQTRNVLDELHKKAALLGMGEITCVSVAFSPDGKYLAVGAIEGYQYEAGTSRRQRLTLYLLDIGNGMVVNYVHLAQHVATPSSGGDVACNLAFSPDSSCLAVSLRDKNWNAYEPDSGSWHVELSSVPFLQPIAPSLSQPGTPFSFGDIEIERLALSGPLLAARAGEDQWKIWEVATGRKVASMTAEHLVFSTNGGWLAVARGPGLSTHDQSFYLDWGVLMYHVKLPGVSPAAELEEAEVIGAFANDVVGGIGLRMDDIPRISLYGSTSYPVNRPVTCVEFSPNARYLLVNHGGNAELLRREFKFAGASGELKIALAFENLQSGSAFSPEGRYLVAATSSGVRTWLIKDGDDATLPVLITIGADASPVNYTFRLRNNKGVGFNKDVTFTVERNA